MPEFAGHRLLFCRNQAAFEPNPFDYTNTSTPPEADP